MIQSACLHREHASPSSPVQASETESQWPKTGTRRGISPKTPGDSALKPLLARMGDEAIDNPHSLATTFRHSGWVPDRRRIRASLERTGQAFARQIAFEVCGSHAYVLRNVDDPERYRIAGSACKDRFCVPCATERSSIIAGNVTELVQDKEIRFLTLTIKTDDMPLAEALDKLYKGFADLRRRRIWTDNVTGGVAFLEVKYIESSQRWHPHLHCLIEGRWMDKHAISDAWLAVTGDSYIVDIRAVRNNDTLARYVTKYASKPFDRSFVRVTGLLDEAVLAMKARKLAITFGSWRGKLLTITPEEGAWEHVAPLSTVISMAANGDDTCRMILACLTDCDLTDLFSRAPPSKPTARKSPPSQDQLTWFGVWRNDGTYRCPND